MRLEVKDIGVHYGRMQAVSNISLCVESGQFVAIVGANGAGKTTTLRTVSGLVRPSSGSITIDGESITRLAPHQIARRGIAHVPEGRGMLPSLTVAENLKMGVSCRPDSNGLAQDYERVFGYFPVLKEKLQERASVLSGGEQQMLSLSRALLSAPRLLMVDEMSLGLAPKLTHQLLEVVADLPRSGMAVLCVEQNTKLVLKKADYAYVFETGRVSHNGTGLALSADESIVNSYLGRTDA